MNSYSSAWILLLLLLLCALLWEHGGSSLTGCAAFSSSTTTNARRTTQVQRWKSGPFSLDTRTTSTTTNRLTTRIRHASTATPIDASSSSPSSSSSKMGLADLNFDTTTPKPVESVDVVVCGGGPAGLLTAIMLAQKLPPTQTIRLYDRLSAPPNADDEAVWNDVAKFYLIGLGGRGQSALDEFGTWKDGGVEDRCVKVVGRRDWQPGDLEGTERIFTKLEKRVPACVLPRDKLVGVLHQHITEQYPGRIELNYGYEVHPLDFEYQEGTAVLVEIAQCSAEIARLNPSSVKVATEEAEEIMCSTENTQLLAAGVLIAADGTVRTVANAMERADAKRYQALNPLQRLWAPKPFRVKRYVDDNQRIYKSIPMKLPPGWRGDLNYSARSGRASFDALPANNKGDYCGVFLLKKGDPLAQADTDPQELRKFMDESFPYFSRLIDDETLAMVAKKPVSYLPSFRYAGPRLHQGNRCVILGDCAHTVKPYFGLGANSALEDVRILGRMIDADFSLPPSSMSSDADVNATTPRVPEWSAIVRAFSNGRAADSKALVRISRDLDRPGKLGFITFLLPLILDSIFTRYLSQFFTPNIINMLQREGWTFQRVARRKRMERLAQVTILGTTLTAIAVLTTRLVQFLLQRTVFRWFPQANRPLVAAATVVAAGLGGFLVSSLARPKNDTTKSKTTNKGMPATADVITKFSKKEQKEGNEEESR